MAEIKTSNTNGSTTIASLNELTTPRRSLMKDAWFRLIRNKGAVVAMFIIAIFFLGTLFANKIVPHNPLEMNSGKDFLPPAWVERGPTGEAGQKAFLFGTDTLGRDVLSRTFYGSSISLSIGFVGVLLSFFIGVTLGGLSGYFGGIIDEVIQRIIDFLLSIPALPFWMALAAALPRDWSVTKTYFAITVILSVIGWSGLARVVRGKLLALREEDYSLAAQAAGASQPRIIFRHLLPGFTSHLIVSLTLAIPGSILGETTLSFLGLGMQPPAVSWGVLLQDAQDMVVVAQQPWRLIPGLFVVVAVLLFNFVGDGLRDAADPYTT